MALKIFVPFEIVIPFPRINVQEIDFYEDKILYTIISITLFIMKKKGSHSNDQ